MALWLLIALAIAHLAFSFRVNPPGYLTYDSGTYHFMAKTFAETGSFIVKNGFEELPSPELEVAHLRTHAGHLVAQYPEFLSVLVYPLYAVWGWKGLFLLNALAFLAINFFIFRLALRLTDDSGAGYLAMLVYSAGTFAWEYSQSSYPHLSSTLFILAAYSRLADGLAAESWRRACVRCAAAGLVAGFAVGLRLDAAFAIPGLFLPLLFSRPLRGREIAATAAGLVPGMLFLSFANAVKFGTFFPFKYGTHGTHFTANLAWYLPFTGFAFGAVALVFIVLRRPAARRRGALALVAAGVVLAVLAFPARAWDFVSRLVDGTYQIAIDMRIRDLDIREASLGRTWSGAMVYIGGVKKSLLQSCPYLAIVPFFLFDAFRRRERLAPALFLTLVPASFLGIYGYLAWHGSIALNMRYLNPILPFTSILAAVAWRSLADRISSRFAALYAGLLFFGLLLIFRLLPFPIPQQELWFLTVPLVLAAAVILFETVRRCGWTPTLGGPLVGYLLLTTFAWSGAMAFGRDYPASARVRDANLQIARSLQPFIEDDALIFSNVVDVCWGLMDHVDDLRIARPEEDAYETFQALAKHHLARGRKVYLVYTPNELRTVVEGGYLGDLRARMRNVWTTGGQPSLMLLELESAQHTSD